MREGIDHNRLGSISRRQVLLAGGASLVGLSMRGGALGALFQDQTFPGVTTITKAKKPVYVVVAGSTDPVAHSLAESLFWLDQELEHTVFFRMHMPSPELDAQRAQVMQFHGQFADQLNKVKGSRLDRGSLAGFNQSTIDLVRRFVDFKRQAEQMQKSGQMRSLAWPTFFEHTAHEGEHFAKRLEQFSRGNVGYDQSETIDFWTRIMGEHADFIAHLLDPEERMLVEKAMQSSKVWRQMRDNKARASSGKSIDGALDEFIAFKETAGKGIEAGQIKSIIHPTLADHVLREALKFSDELKRVMVRT